MLRANSKSKAAGPKSRLEVERCLQEFTECRKRAELAEALFANIADAVFVAELDGRIIDVNPAVCATLGYSKQELLAMHPWDFVTNASREDILSLIQGMRQGCMVWKCIRAG